MAGPEKSDGAFRTIREVADWLGVPTHVLRFWESKFDQIAPVKGSGGRRYYRPEDMRLLGGIKVMLHDQGMPIRGVSQKIEADGPEAVMAFSPSLDTPDSAAAPKARRVIRRGEDDTVPETVRAPAKAPERAAEPTDPVVSPPRIDPVPEPEEPEPGQPGEEDASEQLGDGTETPQPADGPVEEPLDGSAQPDEPSTDGDRPTSPDTDPEVVSEPDILPEPTSEPSPLPGPAGPAPDEDGDRAPAAPDVDPAAPDTPAKVPAEAAGAIVVRPENQRRLRRVIRKLRGLIAEVEDEVRAARDATAEE